MVPLKGKITLEMPKPAKKKEVKYSHFYYAISIVYNNAVC